MQEYVIDLYRHFLFRFFWAMSKVMYLVILLSFCYLTEDYMVCLLYTSPSPRDCS